MKRSISLQLAAFVVIRVVLNTMIRMVYPYSNAFASGLTEDKFFLGLVIDYMPKPGLGGASTFHAFHDQESL